MFKQSPLKLKHLSKHTVLKHFIETADKNRISQYHMDPYFSEIPNEILLEYIHQLADDGYLKPMLRHVVLNFKAYSYLSDRRSAQIKHFFSRLCRPLSYLVVWILGVYSTLVTEYLVRVIFPQS